MVEELLLRLEDDELVLGLLELVEELVVEELLLEGFEEELLVVEELVDGSLEELSDDSLEELVVGSLEEEPPEELEELPVSISSWSSGELHCGSPLPSAL